MTVTETRLHAFAPAFAVASMDRMLAFYGKLGFEPVYHTDVYAVLQRDGVQLHLYPEREKFRAGQGNGYLYVMGVDEIYEQWRPVVSIIHPLANKEYGLRDFLMEDPEGNRIGVAARPRLPAG
jgi:catechol 2,3-dioxygenase-like lactoylglutathione lyase family enzyme